MALLVEDVALDVDLQAGVHQPEAPRHGADADEHRGRVCVFGAVHRHAKQLVLAQDLDDALGAALALGQEEHLVATFAGSADIGHPLVHAAVELGGGLAADVPDARGCGVVFHAERVDPGSPLQPRRQVVPRHEQLVAGARPGSRPARPRRRA